MDTVISLRRPTDYKPSDGAVFELHFEKSREFTGDEAKPIQLSLTKSELGDLTWSVESVEESTLQKVISLNNEGLLPKEIVEELGINKSTVSRHLKTARDGGLLKI